MKRSKGVGAFTIVNTSLMLFLCFVTLYPFIFVAFGSVSDPAPLLQHLGILWKPYGFQLRGYGLVFRNPLIVTSYLNTLFYVTFGTALNLVMTTMAAYVLSRKNLYWKRAIVLFIVVTMFLNGGMIPLFLLVRSLGLYNTRLAVIVPVAINTGNLIIMRTAFMSVPASLEESAKMDGASPMTILLRIILPLSLPVVAVMALFYSVAHWNSWFNAMIFLKDRELYPIQLILREVLVQGNTERMMQGMDLDFTGALYTSNVVKYATTMVATVPILIVYPFIQKYFVKGVMIGSLKG